MPVARSRTSTVSLPVPVPIRTVEAAVGAFSNETVSSPLLLRSMPTSSMAAKLVTIVLGGGALVSMARVATPPGSFGPPALDT